MKCLGCIVIASMTEEGEGRPFGLGAPGWGYVGGLDVGDIRRVGALGWTWAVVTGPGVVVSESITLQLP